MSTLWWIALTAGWLCVSFGLLVAAGERQLLPLATALISLVTVLGIVRSRYALTAGIVSAALFAGVWIWAERSSGNPAAVLAVVTACGGMVWLSRSLQRRIAMLYQLLRTQRDRIEALSVEDATGAIKLEAGKAMLAEEVERGRRYRRPLAVLRVGLAAPDEWVRVRGMAQFRQADRSLALMLREMVRTIDRVVHHDTGEFVVVLPETPLDGARIVAHRFAYAAKERLESEIRVGIAEFPTDGQTTEELIQEADAALHFARGADLSVVSSE